MYDAFTLWTAFDFAQVDISFFLNSSNSFLPLLPFFH